MTRRPSRVPDVLAAVDLGSNSFHMVVARYSNGQLVVIDRLREMVRLAAGLGEDGRLDKDVAARALACMKRFGQRLADVHADGVRVVGTSALRRARRKQGFLERARDALGHPVEIIAGREEARLIYSGVCHMLPPEAGNRLVVDIGDGKLSAKRFARARLAAQQELEPIQEGYLKSGWDSAAGSSGSVRAILEAQKEMDPRATVITQQGIESLIELLCGAGHADAIPLEAVTEERRSVFAGGLAVLAEIFAQLKIRQMRWSEGAMREGILSDMVGRYTDEDARDRTVRSLQQRYHVDVAQAARVEQTALRLLSQVQDSWQLQNPLAEQVLVWASRLHEIGLDVAHSGYHRHGAYLLQNADMPGFAREEQLLLSRLVGCHRRKLVLEDMDDLIPPWDERALYLILVFRIAVLLHRSRSEAPIPEVTMVGRPRTLELRFRIRFRDHPLTAADLNDEVEYLRAQGLRLRVLTS